MLTLVFLIGGLLYLSLWLSSKFAIAIPYLHQYSGSTIQPQSRGSTDTELLPLHLPPSSSSGPQTKPQQAIGLRPPTVPIYSLAAAPPNYGLVLILIPIGVAAYISSTRYVEFWHFGFDIISGTLIGKI